jgi:hypothetical protein
MLTLRTPTEGRSPGVRNQARCGRGVHNQLRNVEGLEFGSATHYTRQLGTQARHDAGHEKRRLGRADLRTDTNTPHNTGAEEYTPAMTRMYAGWATLDLGRGPPTGGANTHKKLSQFTKCNSLKPQQRAADSALAQKMRVAVSNEPAHQRIQTCRNVRTHGNSDRGAGQGSRGGRGDGGA